MDGLSRCCGAPAPVRLEGNTYLMEPLTLRRLGCIEAHIIGQRVLPTDQLKNFEVEGISQELFDNVQRRAIDELRQDFLLRIITTDQLQEYLWTEEGIAFSVWITLFPNYPEKFSTLEKTALIVGASSKEEIETVLKLRGMISGIDLISQLDWRSWRDELLTASRQNGDREEKYEPMPWRKILRNLADARFNSPVDWRDLTLYELHMLTCQEHDLGGTQQVSGPEAQRIQRELGKKPKPIIVIGNEGKGLKEWAAMKAATKARRDREARQQKAE